MSSEKLRARTRMENKTHKQNSKAERTFIKSIRETLSPNRLKQITAATQCSVETRPVSSQELFTSVHVYNYMFRSSNNVAHSYLLSHYSVYLLNLVVYHFKW